MLTQHWANGTGPMAGVCGQNKRYFVTMLQQFDRGFATHTARLYFLLAYYNNIIIIIIHVNLNYYAKVRAWVTEL